MFIIAYMKKAINVLVILINLFLFVCTMTITVMYFIGGGEGNMEVLGVECFNYFTIDSNIICGLGCLLYAIYYIIYLAKGKEIPSWVNYVKVAVTGAILVTFLTCAFFLGPTMGYDKVFLGRNVFLHGINPILAFITFCFLEKGLLPKKTCVFAIIPTFIYSIVYIICVVFAKVWEDFYGFTFGGRYGLIPVVLVVMYGVSCLIGLGIIAIKNAISKKN